MGADGAAMILSPMVRDFIQHFGEMGCNLCAWACPYGARELDSVDGTMKKCTLCIDRIYDENLPENERQPARVFGDFDDPDSEVSRLTRERNGGGLLPELGYKPVNQYLPPRKPVQILEEEFVAEKRIGVLICDFFVFGTICVEKC